jgi:8-oxo-dGTP pyrophosphatase MutT (NUDIX family)
MAHKTKKAQVVLAALDAENHSFLFLLMQTNEKRGSYWQNVTGKIDEGESFDEGALREAEEETGLHLDHVVEMIDLKIEHTFIDFRDRDCRERAFLVILSSPWEVKIDPHEHQAFKWVPLKDIRPDSVRYEGNYEALEKSSRILKGWRP